jgi:4a-hydroxytetrahydrobiopterin dehydratase
MNRDKMEAHAIGQALARLNAGLDRPWQLCHGKLNKAFHFKDFVEAFGFLTRCAPAAEAMTDHPEGFNVYATVRVDLSTHDAGGITEMDFALAGRMEALAE